MKRHRSERIYIYAFYDEQHEQIEIFWGDVTIGDTNKTRYHL